MFPIGLFATACARADRQHRPSEKRASRHKAKRKQSPSPDQSGISSHRAVHSRSVQRIGSMLEEQEASEVRVDVEYCGTCGHIKQFIEMAQKIKEALPDAKISGEPGRQASFEVRVNDELVHSKLQTMAFPDFNEVTELVKDVSKGKSINKIQKHQAIDCVIS